MLTTFSDIQNDVIVKLGVTTTTAYYTDDIINDWIQQAERWATSYKKWPFTEGRQSTTYTTANEEWNFEGIRADTIRMLQVGGKRFKKLNFEDYQIFREETPSDSDRVFSDFGRLVFVNPSNDATGTMTIYAQYAPAPIDVTDDTAETVFSNGNEEGNEAIVEEVLSYAYTRKNNENKENYHHTRATQILDALYGRVADEQFNYKTHKTRGGMWERIDAVNGEYYGESFKRDQF